MIRNGVVVDPATGLDDVRDLLVDGSKIIGIAPRIRASEANEIDASGMIVAPGLIDMHVHLRQPGGETKELIYTGTRAAAHGGFASVVCEPNTHPPMDQPACISRLLDIVQRDSLVNGFAKGCISMAMNGTRIAPIVELKRAGVVAITDDGHPIVGDRLMQNALVAARDNDLVVTPHCEETALSHAIWSDRKQAHGELIDSPFTLNQENHYVKRDITLARKVGARLHISHISKSDSIQLVALAKEAKFHVTAEATPHHFAFSCSDAESQDTYFKMNPPLRSPDDVDAVRSALADGTIDVIASDHAPHAACEKAVSWDEAPFGVIGLETTLGAVWTYLVKPGILSPAAAIKKLTLAPAEVLGIPIGRLQVGGNADITIIDPCHKWQVDVSRFLSRGRNSPFGGCVFEGKAGATVR